MKARDSGFIWTEIEEPGDFAVFRDITPLRGYPATLPESFLTGYQGRGFVTQKTNALPGADSPLGAILILDFLFVTSLIDDEETLGRATADLVRRLLSDEGINAVHLLPPLCAGKPINPGSSPFYKNMGTGDFTWRNYVRMEFIGNAGDHRSENLAELGFPGQPVDFLLRDGTGITVRGFFGSQLGPSLQAAPQKGAALGEAELAAVLQESWSADLINAMGGIEEFSRYGMGVFLYDGDELVCGASSFCRYTNAIEVEVDTKPDRRKSGLARWAGAALSLMAAAHDQYLCWDAAHPSSARIAIDLGLGFCGHYICSVYRFADASSTSAGGIEH